MNNSATNQDDDMVKVENEITAALNESTQSFQSFENVIRIYLSQNYYHIMLWHMFHSFSVFYPDEPSDVLKVNTKLFLNSLKNMTGCSGCSNNKNDVFVSNCNLDDVVGSKTKMVAFFNDYHKYINVKILKKPDDYDLFTNDYIISKYSGNEFTRYFENKYSFNLLHFLNNGALNEETLKKKFTTLKIECSQHFKTKKLMKIVFS